MSHSVLKSPFDPLATARKADLIARGKSILDAEIEALQAVSSNLDSDFAIAVQMLFQCRGSVIVTGMGKAGIVGKKLAASFSSTGTPSYFMHPAEAVHGDLGSLRSNDLVLLLSYSGETEEITRLLPFLNASVASLLAITSHSGSTLAKAVDLALLLGVRGEACALGLAPTCSTTAMLALGDALALVVSEQRGFTREQFARFHPAGSLGKQLTKVEDAMRPLAECRLASQAQTIRQVLIHVGRPGRRTGAIMLVDSAGSLVGIFTDSDLARLLESSHESELDRPIADVMTRRFQTITDGRFLAEAMQQLAQHKISELPVVSKDARPLGIIDVTDVLSAMSTSWTQAGSDETFQPHILSLDDHRRCNDE